MYEVQCLFCMHGYWDDPSHNAIHATLSFYINSVMNIFLFFFYISTLFDQTDKFEAYWFKIALEFA